jgi:hypothetical protein
VRMCVCVGLQNIILVCFFQYYIILYNIIYNI